MNTTINQTGYPIFLPNQVLRNKDLNQLVEYLDSQNHLTRTHLIGMGIIAGMEVGSSYTKEDTNLNTKLNAKIYLSPGCGITSEGDVIDFTSQIQLTHYQIDVKVSPLLFAQSQDTAQINTSVTYEVIELFQKSGDKRIALQQNPNSSPRSAEEFQEFIRDRVLVVVCETLDVQNDFCLFEYDELSKYRQFQYRFFLLPRTQNPENSQQLSAETLLNKAYQISEQPWQGLTVENIFNARNHFLQEFDLTTEKFQDFAPQVQRFGYGEEKENVDLTEIKDYQAFRENYYDICTNAIAAINNSFPKLFWLFSPFFNAFQPNSGSDFNQLQQRLQNQLKGIYGEESTSISESNEPPELTYGLQYFYDYLSQLVAAFYELAETAFDLMDDYPPETQRFPKFLMLGLVPPPPPVSTEPEQEYILTSPYRSHFTQPPIYNSNRVRLQEVRYLYERLLKLCAKDSFYLLPFYNTPLKITPSQNRSAPLSKQAIPYYLNYPNLYKYWNYDAYRKGRSDHHPAYFRPKRNPEEDNFRDFQDLNYRLDAYNFYRVEGHIGKANDDVLKRIQDYKQRYNLAFDVITLKLGNQASLEDLNIFGQFDDLEADFRRMKLTFQKLWDEYEYEATKNVLLHTLKRSFFGKTSLTDIDYSQLYNPILDRARKAEAYEFVEGETDQEFKLYVRDANNTRIARYVIQAPETRGNSFSDFRDLIINFSELSSEEITQRKQQIINAIATGFSLNPVTYSLVIDTSRNQESNNLSTYHLKFSTEDVVDLPSPPQYSPILLSENHFSISLDPENLPVIDQEKFPDFETLYSWLRDVPEALNTNDYQIGNPEMAEELNYFEFPQLIDAYRQRLERLLKLHLFPNFAQQHPGMEHLGGVPQGGTFILVYVDGEEVDQLLATDKEPAIHKLRSSRTEAIQKLVALPKDFYEEYISNWERLFNELRERKDIVIADFCLPYRCSSDANAVSYVVARSRPIILLEKTVFCEGDTHKYEFTLEPEGGTVKGEGIVFEGSKQLFQPSSIDQTSRDELANGSEVAITFTYAVDDTYDTLTVTIRPLPRPNLSVINGQIFCRSEENVEIKLAEDTPENIELTQVKINDTQTNTLNLSQYAAGNTPETVKITALIRDRQTQCENSFTYDVIINSRPEAELSVRDGQTFCRSKETVEIKLAEATPENIELTQVKINDTQTNILNLSEYAAGDTAETVTITALIRDRQTQCSNTLTRTITINPLPQADLSIRNGQSFCQNADPINITLADDTPENIKLTQVQINDTQTNTLNPREFATEGEPETLTITAVIRNQQTQCTNTLTRSIVINPLPQANLSILDEQSFCQNADPINITLAEDTPENIELIEVIINDTKTNTLNPREYAATSEPETVTITALIRNQQTQCTNTLTRSIVINPLPQADLSVSNQQIFCQNADPINITLADDTPENIELTQVKINDTQTSTLNPREFATEGVAETVTITALIRNQQTQCENTLTRTVTINSLPQANFQAEITNISDSGFVVSVFDIQPAEETSFTFNWEHDGIPNVSNPGNNGFIISYNYDPDTWVPNAEKSITLRVQTPPELGSCTSEPVTKTIPIPIGGVEGFNLLTISNNQIINTITLESNNNTFNVSDFDDNNEYAIAAITIPATVGSVVFTYTPPNASAEVNSPVNNKPYHLPNWQPTVGIHQITAQAAREINGDRPEGNAATVTIRINDDNNGEPEPIPDQPTPRTLTLPNRLRVLFQPSDEDSTEFKAINEEKIQPSQVLVLDQPHFDRWNQEKTTKEKNFIFSALTRQSNLGRLIAISATTLLLIAGWTYTVSRQTENHPNPASRVR